MRRAPICFRFSAHYATVIARLDKARIAPTFGDGFPSSRAPAADYGADNQKSAEPSHAIDDREHHSPSLKRIVGRNGGQRKTEPAEGGRDNARAHREHVHVQKDAVEHPSDDDFADEYHDKWGTFRDARFGVQFSLALFNVFALRSHPRLAERCVINATENPGGDGGN